jgi:predicted DNA-binding ribbon-helix-helix protein
MAIPDSKDAATAKPFSLRVKIDSRDHTQSSLEANQNAKSTSTLICRNIVVNGHRTSVRLEPEVWSAIDDVTCREKIDRNHIFTTIASRLAENQSLSSAIRAFVITYYRESSTESGHARAGHGPNYRG